MPGGLSITASILRAAPWLAHSSPSRMVPQNRPDRYGIILEKIIHDGDGGFHDDAGRLLQVNVLGMTAVWVIHHPYRGRSPRVKPIFK